MIAANSSDGIATLGTNQALDTHTHLSSYFIEFPGQTMLSAMQLVIVTLESPNEFPCLREILVTIGDQTPALSDDGMNVADAISHTACPCLWNTTLGSWTGLSSAFWGQVC